jgi:hypothetical protein
LSASPVFSLLLYICLRYVFTLNWFGAPITAGSFMDGLFEVELKAAAKE